MEIQLTKTRLTQLPENALALYNLSDVDQNQGILKVEKIGSVEATIDSGVLQTPSHTTR